MKKTLTTFTVLLIGLSLIACSKNSFQNLKQISNRYNLSTEKLLADSLYNNKIDSLYESGKEGFFTGANSIKIYYRYFIQDTLNSNAIVISSGRTEAAVKYKEVIYDLYKNGYSIYIHDHRGQGFSGRMTAIHDMGFVDKFDYYVEDMKQFFDKFIIPNGHENIFLLSHSMGGTIGLKYLEKYQDDFSAAVLLSPMLGLQIPICQAVTLLTSDKPAYAIGQGDFDEWFASFDKTTLTNCKIRYNRMAQVFEKYPKVQLGGASYQWIYKSCEQFSEIFDAVSNLKTPIMLFSGLEDKVVSIPAQHKFVDEVKLKNRQIDSYSVAGAKHELLMENDSVRIKVITKLLDFYASTKN